MSNGYHSLKAFANMYLDFFEKLKSKNKLSTRYVVFNTIGYNNITVSVSTSKVTIYIYRSSLSIEIDSKKEMLFEIGFGLKLFSSGIYSQFFKDLRVMDETQFILTYGREIININFGWLDYMVSNEDLCKKNIIEDVIGVTSLYLEGELE